MRIAKETSLLRYVCLCVCVPRHMHMCFQCNWNCFEKIFHFSFLPNMDDLCNYHTHIPSPPPIGECNYLLLTVLKQNCHSKVAALQGYTAPVCRFWLSLTGKAPARLRDCHASWACSRSPLHPQPQIEMSKYCTWSLQD